MRRGSKLAYIVGVALGDGNLSCPNGRATRLRVTCDTNYPGIIQEIERTLEYLLPNNKVSRVPGPKPSYLNISVYSNKLNEYMPWKVGYGSKYEQSARVPQWIIKNDNYAQHCLKGLIQTDGSIYADRGYTMINFTNITEALADDVLSMMQNLDYKPHKYKIKQENGNYRYTIRLSRDTDQFIKQIGLTKT